MYVSSNMVVRVLLITGLAFLVAFPFFGSSFYIQLGTRTMILAILAMSLNLLVGFTGLVSLGHAAFFGVAAYAVYLIAPHAGSLWVTLPGAVLVSGLAALAVGALSLRTRGVFFLMVTLAFGQMFFFLFHDSPIGGGPDGAYIAAAPVADIFGLELGDLRERTRLTEEGARARHTLFYVTLGLMVGVYALIAALLRSLFGHVLLGIRANEHRMRALGYPVYRYKLTAFVIAGMLAGLAGHMWAIESLFVNPELTGWHKSADALLMVILGGMHTVYGPILGAFALTALQEGTQLLTRHSLLLMGVIIILIVLFLPRGVAGLIDRLSFGRPKQPIAGQHQEAAGDD